VVDCQADDYKSLADIARQRGIRLEVVSRGSEALRLARTEHVALWVINVSLPDLAGAELCAMLKCRDARTVVYLVAQEYSPDLERAAWAARATLFGCKPAHEAWLAEWLDRKSNQPDSHFFLPLDSER
jgi:DNA-binding response OmpR family regulator